MEGDQIIEGLSADMGADLDFYGLVIKRTAGEDLVFGDFVYAKSDEKFWKADADAAASMPCVAMVVETIAADASGEFLVQPGVIRNDAWSWTAGADLFVSVTAGALSESAPGSGKFAQIAAYALTATQILFTEKVRIEQA